MALYRLAGRFVQYYSYLVVIDMFTPTHVAHIYGPGAPRMVALRLMQRTGGLEVFRDLEHAEVHQWGELGVPGWTEYRIRALRPQEQLPAHAMRPVGPPAVSQYRVSEPHMHAC